MKINKFTTYFFYYVFDSVLRICILRTQEVFLYVVLLLIHFELFVVLATSLILSLIQAAFKVLIDFRIILMSLGLSRLIDNLVLEPIILLFILYVNWAIGFISYALLKLTLCGNFWVQLNFSLVLDTYYQY
jgi:hypothetical protein